MSKHVSESERKDKKKKKFFLPFTAEDEFVVNSVKPTKLNANKLAAAFDPSRVGVALGRKRRVCRCVCVFSAAAERHSNDLMPDVFCGCFDGDAIKRWMLPRCQRSTYGSQSLPLLIQAQVSRAGLAALTGNNDP